MIPVVGVIVACYVFMRAVEIFARANHDEDLGGRVFLMILALGTMVVALFGGFLLAASGL